MNCLTISVILVLTLILGIYCAIATMAHYGLIEVIWDEDEDEDEVP